MADQLLKYETDALLANLSRLQECFDKCERVEDGVIGLQTVTLVSQVPFFFFFFLAYFFWRFAMSVGIYSSFYIDY